MIEKPTEGSIWKSANGSALVTVESVFDDEEEPGSGFFLVTLTEAGNTDLELEFNPEEWAQFVMANALTPA